MLKKLFLLASPILALSAPAAANLVANPGFEYIYKGKPAAYRWRFDSPVKQNFITFDDKVKNSGKYSLRADLMTPHKSNYIIRQHIMFKEPTAVAAKIRFSMRCSALNLKRVSAIIRGNSTTKAQAVWTNVGSLSGSFDWKTVSGEINMPPNMKFLEISIRLLAPGTFWLDDVSLEMVEADAAATATTRGFDGKVSKITGLPGSWAEKKYHGNENVSTVAVSRENGKMVAVQKYTTGAPRSGFSCPLPKEFAKQKYLRLSGSFRNLTNGSVQAGFEFFDAKGNSIGELLTPPASSAKWKKFSRNFLVPKNTVSVAVLLLNTGRAEARFAPVTIAPGSADQALELEAPAISVRVHPVCNSPIQLDVKTPEFNTFTNSPTKLTFHFTGERARMKNPTLYLDLPAEVKIVDAVCPHPANYRQEKYTVSDITRPEGKYRRWKFTKARGMLIAGKTSLYQRRLVVLIMPEKAGTVFNGKKVFYHLENNGIKDREETFNLNMLPAMEKTPNPKRFIFQRWNDEDITWSNDDAFVASLLCQEEANYIWVSRYSYPEHIRTRKIMEKRGWKFFIRGAPNLAMRHYSDVKEMKVERSVRADGKFYRSVCPTFLTYEEKFFPIRDRLIENYITSKFPKPGEFIMSDNEQWGPMDWCFCLRCRTEFARQQKLKSIPDAATIRSRYREQWRDFRLEHERRLVEMVYKFAKKHKLVYGDYNYIVDYSKPDYTGRFYAVAKNAKLNEAHQDFHLTSYYHYVDAAGFDMMTTGIANLKKPYVPILAIDGPGYLSRANVLNPARYRMMILTSAVTGCKGVSVYPGERMDGKFYIAADRAMAEIAALENFFLDGRLVNDFEIKAMPFSSTTVKTAGKELVLEMPRWNESFRYNVRRYKGQKLISLLNYNPERTAYVSVKTGSAPAVRNFGEYITRQKITLPAGQDSFIIAVPPRDARMIVIGGDVPAGFTPAVPQSQIRAAFETEKKNFNAGSAPLAAWQDRDFEFTYSDINADSIPEVVIRNNKLALTITPANGAAIDVEFNGKKLFVPQKLNGTFAEVRLWVPKQYQQNMMFKKSDFVSVRRDGGKLVAEQLFTGSPLTLDIRRIYTLERNSGKLTIKTVYLNTGKHPLTIAPWNRSVYGSRHKDYQDTLYGPVKGKEVIFERPATSNKLVLPLRSKVTATSRGAQNIAAIDAPVLRQVFAGPGIQLRYKADAGEAVAFYLYHASGTSTVEWHNADTVIAPGKTLETTDVYEFSDLK